MEKHTPFKFTLGLFLSYTLCLLLFVAPFLRGLFFQEYFLPFIIAIGILFILFLIEQFKRREEGLFRDHLDWALLALLLASVISLISAVDMRSAIIGVMKNAAYIMVFCMCYWISRRERGIYYLLSTIYTAGIVMAIFGLLVYCGLLNYSYTLKGERIEGTFEYANTLGIYLAILSIIGWGFILSSKQLIFRSILVGGNALLIIVMIGSLSRGTLLLYPLAIVAFILLVGTGKRLPAFLSLLAFLIPGLLVGNWFLAHWKTPLSLLSILLGFILALGIQLGMDYIFRSAGKESIFRRLPFKIILSGILIIVITGIFSFYSMQNTPTRNPISRLSKLSLQSFQDRLEFNQDALEIVKDHPIIGVGAGGWNALYHRYASHLYWTSLTHNYFLQTWVETGTIGFLALIAIWVAFIRLLWKVCKRPTKEDDPQALPLFWGVAVAVFLLGAHSIIDVDMSYPAIAVLLFGMMGALKGQAIVVQNKGEIVQNSAGKKSRKKKFSLPWSSKDLTILTAGGIVAIIIAGASMFFWVADLQFRKAESVLNQDLVKAASLMDRSLKLDPLNAEHWARSAAIMATWANQGNVNKAYNLAIAYTDKAVQLAPYNQNILTSVVQTYITLGQYDKASSVINIKISNNPWEPASYEELSYVQIIKGLSYLNANQIEKAKDCWTEALKVNDLVPSNMDVTPVGFYYYSGQAHLLLGERSDGERQLEAMLNESDKINSTISEERSEQIQAYKLRSRAWLAASLDNAGKSVDAEKLIKNAAAADRDGIKELMQQAKEWLNKANSKG